MDITIKALVDKLNEVAKKGIQEAMSLALTRTNHAVEIEHFLYTLATNENSDLVAIFRQFEVNPSRLGMDLVHVLDRFKTGSSRNSLAFSPRIPQLIQDAWLIASCEDSSPTIRTGHLMIALLANRETAQLAYEASGELKKIQMDVLRTNFSKIVSRSKENASAPATPSGNSAPTAPGTAKSSKTTMLDQFALNLTEQARSGKIDPVLGRDLEIRQVMDILTRRRKNNPILTGEAGVGKTAVVEGLALRIASGDVPEPLKKVELRVLDLGALQAGAGVKGEFESRLKGVIDEVKASAIPIILFIDEAHTLIGAGNQAGQGDAANLLKPALARGELRTIAATTWSEYKKFFEKDAALDRRFQVVKVEEPTEEVAITMMRGLAATMEKHHRVRILDEAVQSAVRLSHRYITARQLPDKCVDVLDTACGRVAMGQAATPAPVEQAQRQIELLTVEIRTLEREIATGTDHNQRFAALIERKKETEQQLAQLTQKWQQEKELVQQIQALRTQLEQTVEGNGSRLSSHKLENLKVELASLNQKLERIQGETPLMHPFVTAQMVAEVVSSWTGIPVGRMLHDQIQTVLSLESRLGKRVIGQFHALETISERIRIAKSNLTDPRKPVGVFLLLGPSGVGKTETAKTLAQELFGGERNLISINMSEYQEKHTVSLLKGSPPGYVGYGQGGVLTEAVRRKPYSVVLLDEVEKAHRDVLELFYKVFDEGLLEDSEGREIDFKNTVLLLTSNLASDVMMELCEDSAHLPSPQAIIDAVRPELIDYFTPALLGRMAVVPYYPLSDENMKTIVQLQLGKISERINDHYGAQFTYDDNVVQEILSRCREADSGARNIDRILSGTLLPELAKTFLIRMADGLSTSSVHIGLGSDGNFSYEIC